MSINDGPQRLRGLLAGSEAVIAPGVTDAWTARLVQSAGFKAVYMTGAGVANTLLGAPDLGLVTMTEMVAQARNIVNAVDIPVVSDADTGYGGVASVARTIREFEAAGVAGVHLEDQVMPKRCGHFEDKRVVDVDEMVLRLQAALDARRDPDFVIIARTDARAMEGLEAAIARARAYVAVGADAVFVEAPLDRDELRRVGAAFAGVPLVANMVEGGKTPLLPATELQQLGFRFIIYANCALRLAAHAVRDGLAVLAATGTSESLLPRMFSWQERQKLVGLDAALQYERDLLQRADQARAARAGTGAPS